jgi:peptidyl-tRNA hydrolase
MGIFGALFGIKKMNADPDQQHFARLLIGAAEEGKSAELVNWLIQRPWTPSETRTRIHHALSIVKIASVPATYAKAKQIGQEMHEASYRLG